MFRNKAKSILVTCWIAAGDVVLSDGRVVPSGRLGVYPYETYVAEEGLPLRERSGILGSDVEVWGVEDFLGAHEPEDDHARDLVANMAYAGALVAIGAQRPPEAP